MVKDSYTYVNLVIKPYKFEKVLDLKIEEEINEHTKVYIRGIINEDDVDKYVESASDMDEIEIYLKNDDSQDILFAGMVTNINIEAKGNVRELEVYGISATFLMDIVKKERSYQNKAMTYMDLFNETIKDYPNAGFTDEILEGKNIEKLIVQYRETDWEFAKRLASHFNSFVAPNKYFNGPKFYIGVLKNLKNYNLEEFDYSIKKDLMDYKLKHDNEIEDLMEQNLISYEINSEKVLELCQMIEFKNRKLYVYKSIIGIKDSRLHNRYYLMDMKGLARRKKYNEAIKGVSLFGSVADIEKDMVMIKLDIDENNPKSGSMWFQYSTVYSSEDGSGWYFMPEKNDRVKLYFPDDKEENAFVESSVNLQSKDQSRRQNPEIKSLATKYGKEIRFQKGSVEIISNGGLLIRLSDNGGIEINSNKEVQIKSDGNIELNSSKILMEGDEGISLKQGEAVLNILEDITLSGGKVNIE
ncbi:phage tail protein [Wukongibacter baidiensis]|uniref:phage tail protein n=1 Tax=Wukongibacter baidiensis TaxID=1723361 RepID=UPI003D7F6FAD